MAKGPKSVSTDGTRDEAQSVDNVTKTEQHLAGNIRRQARPPSVHHAPNLCRACGMKSTRADGRTVRPDLAIVDETQTSELSGSPLQTRKQLKAASGAIPGPVGPRQLEYSITKSADWLSISPTSGTSNGQADTITVSITTSAFAQGTYIATFTVIDFDASNSPQTIAVTLTITDGMIGGPS
ncbi:MAG: hypothetical protein R3C03_17565 [Pirellulaceae bacterium]